MAYDYNEEKAMFLTYKGQEYLAKLAFQIGRLDRNRNYTVEELIRLIYIPSSWQSLATIHHIESMGLIAKTGGISTVTQNQNYKIVG